MTIEIVEFFQSFQNGFFDLFFNFISFLGEEYIYILLMVILYYGVDKKLGEMVAFSLITATAVNTIIKETVKAPRPFVKYTDGRVTNLRPHTSPGYSFPSGHTQVFTSVIFTVGFYLKKYWFYIIILVLGILMAISRMYLGVHFFEDVVVSLVLGIGYAYLINWIFNKYYDKGLMMFKLYLIYLIVLIPLLFVFPTKTYITTIGMFSGFILAMYFEKRYVNFSVSVPLKIKVARVVIGMVGMMFIQVGFKAAYVALIDSDSLLLFFDFIRYFLLVFTGLGLLPYLFQKIGI